MAPPCRLILPLIFLKSRDSYDCIVNGPKISRIQLLFGAFSVTIKQGLAGPQGRESVVQPMESTVNLTPLSTVSLALAAFL